MKKTYVLNSDSDDDDESQVELLKAKEMGLTINMDTIPKSTSNMKQTGTKDSNISNGGEDQDIEFVIPISLLMAGTVSGGNECTVVVCPEEDLDFHGSGGAIGRFEVNQDSSLTMDLKGFQYTGHLIPGPTAVVCAMHPSIGENKIKIESITDEYMVLVQTGDAMAQLNAVVEKGEMEESFQFHEENVNSKTSGGNEPVAMKESKNDKSSRKRKKNNIKK